MFKKISQHFGGDLKGKKIAIWGLAFKPNTDDMREAPALVLIDQLVDAGALVISYDPVAMDETRRKIGEKTSYSDDPYDALVDANALVLMTEWSEFRVLRYKVLEKLMAERVIFDGRNIYDPEEVKEFGFTYYGIGR